MLVLTRRPGESLVINGDIQVTVLQLQGGKVRVGVRAPAWVSVDRHEVHERRRESGGQDETLIEPTPCI